MRSRAAAAASGCAALVLCSLALLAPAGAGAAVLPSGFGEQVALENLNEPTNFKFAPDGRTFVAEKNGEIVVFPKESAPGATPTLFADLRKQVYDNGDHGLLGLALDPKFDAGRPYVYALYSFDHELGKPISNPFVPRWGKGPTYEGDECPHREVGEPGPKGEIGCLVSGRLVRLTAEGNHAAPAASGAVEKVLLEGWCQQSTTHSIGDLRFGPEGALFLTGGEGAMFSGGADWGQYGNPCGDPPGSAGDNLAAETGEGGALRAQSLLRPGGEVLLSGTLLRVDPDSGEGWPGNPLAGSANANARRILAIGFRNPYRFALNPRSGAAFVNNVGNGQTEEIDRVPIGAGPVYNSGWPCYEGLIKNYQWEHLGNVGCERLYDNPAAVQEPFFHYQHETPVAPGDPCPLSEGSAITGSAFYEGSSYPAAYDGALFFSDAVRGCIYVMFADEDGEPDPSNVAPFISETLYPGVDLEQGPGGDVYYASLYAGTISRIAYDPGAPRAVLKVKAGTNPWGPIGPGGLRIDFDASESSSAEGHLLHYSWDLNGDGNFGEGANAPLEYEIYGDPENVVVGVKVEDTINHKTSVAHLTVYPGDSPPQVTIAEPLGGLTWGVGQEVDFDGSAKAHGGAAIPAKDLYWKVRLLHCPGGLTDCHEHPQQVFPGVESGHLLAPDHDYPAYLHFILTATDGRGLTGSSEVKIAARPVTLQLRSQPAGIPLGAGLEEPQPTPFDLQAIEGSLVTLVAPQEATIGGVTYVFDRWSDGGDRVHGVSASSSATLTAEFEPSGGEVEEPGQGGSEEPARGGSEEPARGGASGGSGSGGGSGSLPPAAPDDQAPNGSGASPRLAEISVHPAQRTASHVAKFTFRAPGASGFQCRIDRKKFAACRSPQVYRKLKLGPHTFRVRAVGADGALVKATVFKWRVIARRPAGGA